MQLQKCQGQNFHSYLQKFAKPAWSLIQLLFKAGIQFNPEILKFLLVFKKRANLH